MVKIFVEGGGNNNGVLSSKCRKGFQRFFEKTELEGKLLRVVASGDRYSAFKNFCKAIGNNENAFLLVDSESPVNDDSASNSNKDNFLPWEHLKNRDKDKWDKPRGASDSHCHLMTTSMETWLLADIKALESYFGKDFNQGALPQHDNIEKVPSSDVVDSLNTAAKNTQKNGYNKSRDSFVILEMIDPEKVRKKCTWADRLIKTLKEESTRQ